MDQAFNGGLLEKDDDDGDKIESLDDVMLVRKTNENTNNKNNNNKSRKRVKRMELTDDMVRMMEEMFRRNPFGENSEPCEYRRHSTSKNCEDNPNCLFGLGEKKNGIWAARPSLVKDVESCPMYETRTVGEVPSGLKNLGATCYVNAMMQTLFMNLTLRKMIYELPGGVEPLIDELQNIFAHMQAGRGKIHDLKPVVELLELQTGIQQDAQEFNKLFLNLLEKTMKRCGNPGTVADVVLSQFQGKQEYVMECSGCGNQTRSSETFLELGIQIKGVQSVIEGLTGYTGVEYLNGTNQFECPNCMGKRDAKRYICISALPDVLNLQLMRFVFDTKTYMKKKLKNAVLIPETLDFTEAPLKDIFAPKVLEKQKQHHKEFVYKLTSVLNHKGQSPYSGHYTADVLDRQRGIWWTFDDETVKKQPENAWSTGSRDAYTVVYERMEILAKPVDVTLPPHLVPKVEQTNLMIDQHFAAREEKVKTLENRIEERKELYKNIFLSTSKQHGQEEDAEYVWVPVDWLQSWIVGSNKQGVNEQDVNNVVIVLDDDEDGGDKKEETKNNNNNNNNEEEEKEKEVLFCEAPSLERYLCPHGKIDPGKSHGLKRVAKFAMNLILKDCKGVDGTTLFVESDMNQLEKCEECVDQLAKRIPEIRREELTIKRMEEIFGQPNLQLQKLNQDSYDDYAVISRKWITAWKRYAQKFCKEVQTMVDRFESKGCISAADLANIASSSGKLSRNINESLVCKLHDGQLSPGMGGKRLILKTDWAFILDNALNGECNEAGTRTFLLGDGFCSECEKMSEKDSLLKVQKNDELKHKEYGSTLRQLLKRRVGHPNLKDGALQPGTYYLIPRSWMSMWRCFHTQLGVKPTPIHVHILNKQLCAPHQQTMIHSRTRRWLNREDHHEAESLLPASQENEPDLLSPFDEIVSEKEWMILNEFYGGGGGGVKLDLCSPVNTLIRGGETAQTEDEVYSLNPPLCDMCMIDAAVAENAKKGFQNERIYVTLLRDMNQVVPMVARNRGGRRTRKLPGTRELKVSSDTNLNTIKLLLMQEEMYPESTSPNNISFFLEGNKELVDCCLTLEQCGVHPEDTVFVRINEGNNVDNEESFSEWAILMSTNTATRPSKIEAETGFSGTALL